MSLSLNVVKEKEKEEDIEKKGQNENEGDFEENQVSMVIENRLFSNPSVSFKLWKLTEI
jgi:hypothetical protein